MIQVSIHFRMLVNPPAKTADDPVLKTIQIPVPPRDGKPLPEDLNVLAQRAELVTNGLVEHGLPPSAEMVRITVIV